MKKWFVIIIFSTFLILCGGCVEAASFRITASTSKINPNGTFSVSVGGDCIGWNRILKLLMLKLVVVEVLL